MIALIKVMIALITRCVFVLARRFYCLQENLLLLDIGDTFLNDSLSQLVTVTSLDGEFESHDSCIDDS